MAKQIDIFEQAKKKRYKDFYKKFYKGVKERYQNELKQAKISKHERISIKIKTTNESNI